MTPIQSPFEMKTCKRCNVTKEDSEFYPRDASCKECRLMLVHAYRKEHLEQCRLYELSRKRAPHRVQARKVYAQTHAETVSRIKRAWAARNPRKRSAEAVVGNCIRDGKLIKQPCVVCGTSENVDAHHEDYSRPYDVIWLCRKHHMEHHAVKREIERVFPERRAANPFADAHKHQG